MSEPTDGEPRGARERTDGKKGRRSERRRVSAVKRDNFGGDRLARVLYNESDTPRDSEHPALRSAVTDWRTVIGGVWKSGPLCVRPPVCQRAIARDRWVASIAVYRSVVVIHARFHLRRARHDVTAAGCRAWCRRRPTDATPAATAAASRATSRVLPSCQCREIPKDTEVREMPQPRGCISVEGPQALLSLAGLRVCQMYADRREATCHGCPGKVSLNSSRCFIANLSTC